MYKIINTKKATGMTKYLVKLVSERKKKVVKERTTK